MKPTQIEQTGKGLKAAMALSILAIMAGTVVGVVGGGWAVFGWGFLGYFLARILAWWNHG